MIDEDEEEHDKNQILREHMARVSEHIAAEEEAKKSTKIIKGADTTKYLNHKKYRYTPSPKQEMSDRAKLKVTRVYQLLIGLMGFIGVGIILLSIEDPIVYWSISEDSVIEIDLILVGCAVALAGIVGIIGFQHRHDKISDRIRGGQHIGIGGRRK